LVIINSGNSFSRVAALFLNAAGKALSALARDVLGWSADIWDFSGELPTLK
jgi:hypothetical protein